MIREPKLLFSVTAKDFIIQTFCTDAKQNGVRLIQQWVISSLQSPQEPLG